MSSTKRRTGRHVTQNALGRPCEFFIPSPLPPNPPLQIGFEVQLALDRANQALGGLKAVTALLPDPWLFVFFYLRKEAVLSSQIEGTRSSLYDLLLFEGDWDTDKDKVELQEVVNYVRAINHGVKQIKSGHPISIELINELHRILLEATRGSEKPTGRFRTEPSWLDADRPWNAEFLPPPNQEVPKCMNALIAFISDGSQPYRNITRAALVHAQFETIHPFYDGNGRIGRILIPLLLCEEGGLDAPSLYVSLYLRKHRDAYVAHLQAIRSDGDWESWIQFFATGVSEVAEAAVTTVQQLRQCFDADRKRIQETYGGRTNSALRLHDALQKRPIIDAKVASGLTKLSLPTLNKLIDLSLDNKILEEVSGKKRNRVFVYRQYLDLLVEGTDLQEC